MDHEKELRDKVWKTWESGQSDPQYAKMLEELFVLEKKYNAVLQTLSAQQQDVICDFVSKCEEMSWRMLEIACTE